MQKGTIYQKHINCCLNHHLVYSSHTMWLKLEEEEKRESPTSLMKCWFPTGSFIQPIGITLNSWMFCMTYCRLILCSLLQCCNKVCKYTHIYTFSFLLSHPDICVSVLLLHPSIWVRSIIYFGIENLRRKWRVYVFSHHHWSASEGHCVWLWSDH